MSQDARIEAARKAASAVSNYVSALDVHYAERARACDEAFKEMIAAFANLSLAAADRIAPDTAETPHYIARRIVCEEWHQAVKEFGLTPNSVTEKVVSSIINRLDRTPWPAPDTAAAVEAHHYLSTACHHGLHDRCRQSCKFCDAECRCSCHAVTLHKAGPA